MNARSVAATDFLAREVAALRISLDSKVDRDDLDDAIARILAAVDRMQGGTDLDEPSEEEGLPSIRRADR
jgi:hypothetical protein